MPRPRWSGCSRRFALNLVALSSLSEAQHVVEPELLERLITSLSGQIQRGRCRPIRVAGWQVVAGARQFDLRGDLPHVLGATRRGQESHGLITRSASTQVRCICGRTSPRGGQVTAGKQCANAGFGGSS